MKLLNKVAIVTGASSGIGKATAELFASEGAKVIVLARRVERLEEMAAVAKANGQVIVPVKCDMSIEADIENAINVAVEQFGTIDILVNNAGIMDNMTPIHELEDDLWDRIIEVNLTGPMRITRSVINIMLRNGGGNIVNVASIGGIAGCRAGTAYTTSKFGFVGMTKNIGYMYADKGIRCNAICPGGVETEIGNSLTSPNPFGMGRVATAISSNPRSGSSEEIATIARFLACDDSSFVNGTVVVADSGWTAY